MGAEFLILLRSFERSILPWTLTKPRGKMLQRWSYYEQRSRDFIEP